MMTKLFSHILIENIKADDAIIIGVSGGPDSTALLHLFIEFSKKTPCRIIVAHINHGIRGREADRDENFVRKLAKKFELPCEVARVKLSGSGLEERGRKIRRAFFEQLRKKYNARWILTAHTEDDQIETILFNFLRGSGARGLAGMRICSGFYLKPFLEIPKSEILKYLRRRRLKFCLDSTNLDIRYRRNFLRRKILPLLHSVNPGFRKTLIRQSRIFRSLDMWTREEARQFLTRYINMGILFPLKDYKALPEALRASVIQEAYRRFNKTEKALPYIKVQEINRMLSRNIGNKRIRCRGGGTFILKNGYLSLHAF